MPLPLHLQGGITPRQLLLVDVLLMALGSLLYLLSLAWMAATGRRGGFLGEAAAAAAQGCGSPPATPGGSPTKVAMVRTPAVAGAAGAAAGSGAAIRAGSYPPSPSPPKLRTAAVDAGSACSSTAELLDWRQLADGASSLAALAAATGLLSPLLGTLTENVSSDSIIACACLLLLGEWSPLLHLSRSARRQTAAAAAMPCCLIWYACRLARTCWPQAAACSSPCLPSAHLYLHDYHFTAGLTAHLSGSLALGCAVCGSVLIASRLRSPLAVYAQASWRGLECWRELDREG